MLMLLVLGPYLEVTAVDNSSKVETCPVCMKGIHMGGSIQGAEEKAV